MKILLLLLSTIGLSASISAQTHTIKVITEGPDSKEITNALEARLGGASRYALIADQEAFAEITVDLLCLKLNSSKGWACAYSISYNPISMLPLSGEVATELSLGGPNYIEIAERIFDATVKATTETRLQEIVGLLRKDVAFYCKSPEHYETCSPPATAKEK